MNHSSEYTNINTMNHSSEKSYYVKKLTQILLSMSVFSFLIFSQSSLVIQSYDYFVSNFSIKLFIYTTERNCIFLLCNGILVLIIQTSGLIGKITPAQSSPNIATIEYHHRAEKVDFESGFQENIKLKNARKLEEKGREDGEKDVIVAVEVERKEDYHQSFEIEENWEDEEEEDGGVDELNKKCEDFIKKMKQEIIQGVHGIK